VREDENRRAPAEVGLPRRCWAWAIARPLRVMMGAALLIRLRAPSFRRLVRNSRPTLDEKNIVMEVKRVPSNVLAQSQRMQLLIEQQISQFPRWRSSSHGPVPRSRRDRCPQRFRYLHHRQPQNNGRTRHDERATSSSGSSGGTNCRVTRSAFATDRNALSTKLIAGVREDLAVKVFGEDFAEMQRTAGRIADVLRKVDGAGERQGRGDRGTSVPEIRIDKAEIGRRGLSSHRSRI